MGIMGLVGKLLRNRRADESLSVWNQPFAAVTESLASTKTLTLTSSEFEDHSPMLIQHAATYAGGANTSPVLSISGAPEDAPLLLIMEDVDVPFRKPIVHTATLLPPATHELAAGDLSDVAAAEQKGIRFFPGAFNRRGYQGPAPIPSHGPHRYQFMVFALDPEAEIDQAKTLTEVKEVLTGRVVARAILTGTYER